jgi:hypothetical protein
MFKPEVDPMGSSCILATQQGYGIFRRADNQLMVVAHQIDS